MQRQPKHPPPLWTFSFILICLSNFILSTAFYSAMPIFALLLQDIFLLTGLTLGIATASYTFAAIITRPPIGYALDTFGRKKILLISYFLFALWYLLYPLATDATTITLIRFCHGALWGITMGAANTTAVDLLPPKRRGEGIGFFGMGMILGMACGPAFGVHILENYGFTTLFYCATFLTSIGYIAVCCVKFPQIPPRLGKFTLSTLFESTSLPTSLVGLLFCIPYGTLMNFTSIYALTIPGASARDFFITLAVGTALTRFGSGRIFDRLGPSRLMFASYCLLCFGMTLLLTATSPYSFAIAGFFLGLGYGISIPIAQAMINALVPAQRRGAANATFMTFFDLGICCGLLLTSTMQFYFGWNATFYSLLGCYILSGGVFKWFALPAYTRALKN